MRESKIKAKERREHILTLLRQAVHPLKGSALAEQMRVTRQVIVGDISLLKAAGEPIIATSQGYVYMADSKDQLPYKKMIVCQHGKGQVREELNILVDHGVHVMDVIVEHPVYGDITASLGLSTRKDVERFLERIQSTGAAFLSDLTSGIHTHTIAAREEESLQGAVKELAAKGILLES
ncbi:transcription repressor NadR [Halobacillus sp. A1]|uniref:transcription repressor NadR n=1 Tax=Halobacillus sp. A1 TaxID=2880262 RepID=UPI0020A63B0B|nr:transcription repressor NadR [Halobacillus sp. A1]MCP3031037.1 transcription repressor NadR [Halobacillus sp. A1]